MAAAAQTLSQLDSARALALGDGRYYPTIIPGVLPIIGANSNASLEVRRWGAEFLAETFAAPSWPAEEKGPLALTVLGTLKEYLDVDDTAVLKSTIQAAATIYALVFKHIISDPSDGQHWQDMVSIKTNILQRVDKATPGVRICCVKFIQQVVLVQTPGTVDPRRPDNSDVSLALVPRDHPLLTYVSLEAEGQGLLDRLLGIIHGDHSDALLLTAVLNSLGMLIQRRPIAANKILTSVLSFNPMKLANSPMTPRNRVILKSIERTTRALLINVMKRAPDNPNNARIQQFLESMHRTRLEVLDEAKRKRPAPVEATTDSAKRQRLQTEAPSIPDLPPGPVSYRQLFTLNPDANAAGFDVQVFKDPEQLLRILVPVLQSIDEVRLSSAVNAIRSRYLSLSTAVPAPPVSASKTPLDVDDDDEYEPDFEPEDAEQVENRLDSLPSADAPALPVAPLAPYKLPQAPPLSQQEVVRYGDMSVRRAFGILGGLEEKEKAKVAKGGFNRLAASDYGRDAWITILSRLATRANAGLDDPDEAVKDEYAVKSVKGSTSIAEAVRDALYQYIIYDWKRRIDVAVSWLNEEWYNDQVLAQAAQPTGKANGVTTSQSSAPSSNYSCLALRLLDGILPYIEHTDKRSLLRLLSEIPLLTPEIFERVKKLAEDPERVELTCQALQYLHVFRPPVRTMVEEALMEMWRTNTRARPSARKLLRTWRPAFVEEQDAEERRRQEEEKMQVQQKQVDIKAEDHQMDEGSASADGGFEQAGLVNGSLAVQVPAQ